MAILRINASVVFLSLCLGSVLVQYVGSQTNDLLALFAPKAGKVSSSTIQLFLLLVPAVVTAVVTVFSVHGRIKGLINLLPAAAAAALTALLAVPLLPPHLAASFETQRAWHILSNSEAIVVAAGGFMSLLFLWTQRSSFKQHDKRRH